MTVMEMTEMSLALLYWIDGLDFEGGGFASHRGHHVAGLVVLDRWSRPLSLACLLVLLL